MELKMAIINYTPHDIMIYGVDSVEYDASIRKHILIAGASPVMILPKSGKMLSVKMDTQQDGYIENGIIPIIWNIVTAIDLPDGDALWIVSQVYASAVRKLGLPTDRLLCIGDPVYATSDGKQPMGCLNLQRA